VYQAFVVGFVLPHSCATDVKMGVALIPEEDEAEDTWPMYNLLSKGW